MTSDDPRLRLAAARRLHRTGDVAGALAGYQRVLERAPDHPEVLQLAAMAAAQCGELPAAERLARRAVDVRDDDAARLTLGRVLVQTGALEQAVSCLARIHGETRLAADAAYHEGQALRRLERTAEARHALKRATRLVPGHAPAWNELGVACSQQGAFDEALSCFEESLRLRPGHAPTLTNCATACFHLGDYTRCDRTVRAALAAEPGRRAAEALLGRLRKTQGRLPEAQRIWQSLVERDPADVDAWHGLASTLQAAGELDAAGHAYDTALALAPGVPDIVAARAEWLEWQGRYDDGLETLSALAKNDQARPGPSLVAARLLRRLGRTERARSVLEASLPRVGDNAPLRRQFCFSLGDVCDELGDYPAAWRWYEEGNRLAPGSYDGAAHRRWLRAIEQSAAAPRPDPGREEAGDGVVFIVGMPRSGTSLIEHILAAHPSVHAAGELSTLGELVHGLLAGSRPSPELLTQIGRRYMEALPAPAARQLLITDKMPTNFLYLPVIEAALPRARIVHCRRDPRDSGLSCLFTDFIDPTLAFAARLDWLADYIHTYRDWVRRWLPRFGDRVLEVDYERMVQRPGHGVRELLAFLDLAWDSRCLRSHEQERVMATASHAQVREPIHTRSIGRWRRYEAYLGPLLGCAEPPDQSTSA